MKKLVGLIFIIFLLSLSLSSLSLFALAEETTETGVLADLKKDGNFDMSAYPAVDDDYSLQLLTLAEGKDGELLAYVYQPGAVNDPYRASYIRFSVGVDEDLHPLDYQLALLDYDGVFFKYKVRDFTVSTDSERYYVVVSLSRAFLSGVDEDPVGGNTVSNVSFSVGVQYLFTTLQDGTVSISAKTITVLEITDKFVGILRYGVNQYGIADNGRDFHFVAFSSDFPIDDLIVAEVEYKSQDFDGMWGMQSSFGDIEGPFVSVVKAGEVSSYETTNGYFFGFNLHHRVHSLPQIAKPEDFLAASTEDRILLNMGLFNVVSENAINDEAKDVIRSYDWVLTFLDTPFRRERVGAGNGQEGEFTRISDVSILRLYFVTNGVCFNLGAVDNMQSGATDDHGNPDPVNDETIKVTDSEGRTLDDLWDLIKRIAKVLGLIFGIVIICLVLGPVLPYVLKGVGWVIALPFRLIAKLFRRGKKNE